MKINFGLYQRGNGFDLELTKTGIRKTGAIWTMIASRWWGVGAQQDSSETKTTEAEFKTDYWANNFFLKSKPSLQFNSRLDSRLKSLSLMSGNLTKIEIVGKQDLKYLAEIANITVEASIISEDKLQLNVGIFDPIRKQSKKAQFVLDETNTEPIYQAPVDVIATSESGVLFEDSEDALFEKNENVNFEKQ